VRAVSYERYGSTAELHVVDMPVPSPGPGEVLVQVMATSVNLTDWECLHGSPLYARIGGLRSPANPVLGSDIAGRIEAVGSGVTDFHLGDEVVADNLGTKGGFAEYAIVPASALADKHADLSFAQASTIPQAGAIALQATATVRPGQRVLINGGGGGTGPFAIQLAKRLGAVVTAVDNGGKLDFMRSIGADEVIDYAVEDFTARGERYDLIIDLVAHRSPFAYLRALRPEGRYRWVGGSVSTLLGVGTFGALAGLMTGRQVGVLAVREGPSHFGPLVDLCAAGEVRIVIDREFGLDEVAEAVARVGEGRALGKVVVQVV
jgi:NADPH:quinone reductase-like Zn-dependent oxidoreductase